MKSNSARLALAFFFTSSLVAATDVYFGEDRSPFEWGGPNDVPRLDYTNSQRVAAQFLSRLPGVTTESFEGFATGSSPTSLTFGTNIATLSGTREIETMLDPAIAPRGGFPTTGTNCLTLTAAPGNVRSFTVTFSTPQAAFGFYGTDIEENQFIVRLLHESGAPSDIPVPVVVPQGSGGVLFFGVIDKDRPFTAVEFQSIGTSGEVFFFDDLTIAVPEQVHPEPASIEIALYAGVRIAGTIGATYRIEFATEPDPTDWTAVTNIVLSTSPFLFFDTDSVTSHARRFYRAVTME